MTEQQALLDAAEVRLSALTHELVNLKFMVSGAARQQAAGDNNAVVDLAPIAAAVEKLLAMNEGTIWWFLEQGSALPTVPSPDQPDRSFH